MSSYWVVVGSEDNFLIAKSRGFDMFGFKSRRRREASGMRPGDKLIFYLTKIMKFGGIAAITSEYYEDHDRIFLVEPKKKAEEDYPWRVATKPEIILEPAQYLDVQAIAPPDGAHEEVAARALATRLPRQPPPSSRIRLPANSG